MLPLPTLALSFPVYFSALFSMQCSKLPRKPHIFFTYLVYFLPGAKGLQFRSVLLFSVPFTPRTVSGTE
jgi:hypothetical protein